MKRDEEFIVYKKTDCKVCDSVGRMDVGIPGHEPLCLKCYGNGYVYMEYPLEQALAELLEAQRLKVKLET